MKPIVDSSKTDELKTIQKSDLPKIAISSECKKEVEVNSPEKEKDIEKERVLGKIEEEKNKAGNKDVNNQTKEQKIIDEKESQIKSEGKHSFVSLTSDNLEAPAPANQIKNTNSNGALAPRRDTIVSNNILEENNMGNFPNKVKQFFCGSDDDGERRRSKSVTYVRQRFDFSITNGSDDNSNIITLNDINNSFELNKVNKKMLNGINNKMEELLSAKVNNATQKWENRLAKSEDDMNKKLSEIEKKADKNTEDIKEVNKKVDKLQEEQIDIKAMLAEMKQQTEEIKQQTRWMAELFGKKISKETNKPRRNRNANRESTNTSFSSFRGYMNMNMNNSLIPRMERPDMAYEYNNEG